MTVEEYFEKWWIPKELPETGFNKTAMLDFAEMYHREVLQKMTTLSEIEFERLQMTADAYLYEGVNGELHISKAGIQHILEELFKILNVKALLSVAD